MQFSRGLRHDVWSRQLAVGIAFNDGGCVCAYFWHVTTKTINYLNVPGPMTVRRGTRGRARIRAHVYTLIWHWSHWPFRDAMLVVTRSVY